VSHHVWAWLLLLSRWEGAGEHLSRSEARLIRMTLLADRDSGEPQPSGGGAQLGDAITIQGTNDSGLGKRVAMEVRELL
jgi:hypothetical protein